jgi:ParB family chromosome partitioning protein
MNKKTTMALGRGAAALFGRPVLPSEPTETEEKELLTDRDTGTMMVSRSLIIPDPGQPRKIFKDSELLELSNSIRENGILSPLLVCQTEKGFELIAGERRLRAAALAGLEKVPVIVKRATDKEKKIMSIIENVQRSDLNPVEEALAYYHLIDEYKLTQEEVAKKLGKERSSIANYLRILKLPREVLDLIKGERLTLGHAKVLAAEEDQDVILKLAKETVAQGHSVRELERLIKNEKRRISFPKPRDERLDTIRQKMEQRTGFHITISANKNMAGQILIKFGNESELNTIYEYLTKEQNGQNL